MNNQIKRTQCTTCGNAAETNGNILSPLIGHDLMVNISDSIKGCLEVDLKNTFTLIPNDKLREERRESRVLKAQVKELENYYSGLYEWRECAIKSMSDDTRRMTEKRFDEWKEANECTQN